jgi:hypothetical protein
MLRANFFFGMHFYSRMTLTRHTAGPSLGTHRTSADPHLLGRDSAVTQTPPTRGRPASATVPLSARASFSWSCVAPSSHGPALGREQTGPDLALRRTQPPRLWQTRAQPERAPVGACRWEDAARAVVRVSFRRRVAGSRPRASDCTDGMPENPNPGPWLQISWGE